VEGSCRGIFQGINPAFQIDREQPIRQIDREQPIRLQVLSGKMFKLYS
jgi:hypothetical protein